MSWKKNVFSCLMWVMYLLLIGTAMAFTGSAISDLLGKEEYLGGIAAGVYLLLAGGIVFGLHRMAVKLGASPKSSRKPLLWIEVILVIALFAAGALLRLAELPMVSEESVYPELAYVSSAGQRIPQIAHGAVYIYVWTLHLLFMLLGNKAAAAVGLQIVLQLLGALLLYFSVRKMAGKVPAVLLLAFFLLSPTQVEKAAALSPELLYLLLFSVALLYVSRGADRAPGFWRWFLAGILAAALSYLDVAGLLLLPIMLGAVSARRERAERKISGGIMGCIAGFMLGAAACIFLDVLSSGKAVRGILTAWGQLYRWDGFRLSVTISGLNRVLVITLLLCFMAWGIFSFWCRKGGERFSVWIFCLGMAAVGQCLGIFTEEMNGFCYVFLFSTILAGLGIGESIAVPEAEKPCEEKPAQEELEIVDLNEEDLKTEEVSDDSLKEEGLSADSMKQNSLGEEQKGEERNTASEEHMEGEEKGTVETEKKPEEKQEIEFIENPLPLPKKHVKRVMDYKVDPDRDLGGYDVYVSDDDDFDH